MDRCAAAVVFLLGTACSGGPQAERGGAVESPFAGPADPRRQFAVVDERAYEMLEQAPVRGWGDGATLRPLTDLRSALRRPTAPDRGDEALLRTLPQRWGAILDGFLAKLHLEPSGTVVVDAAGAARWEGKAAEAAVHVGVPTAIVLRLAPAAAGCKLSIAAAEADGLRIEGQELELADSLTQVVVLPVLATGRPGRRELALRATAAGRDSTLPLSVDVRPSGTLTGTVLRRGAEGAGKGLAAKLFIEDEAGRLYVVPGEPNYRTQSWYAPWQVRFSYVEGRFRLPLPPGRYRLTTMKGYGWHDWEGTVEVQAGQAAECRIEMGELRPLEDRGWYCGDMHIHGRGAPTLAQLRAEDVNVAANTLYSTQKAIPLPLYEDRSDAAHLNTSNQEIEHWNFGNTFYFNIPTTVVDPKGGGPPEMTPMFHYDQQAHAMGGITLRWLRGRAFAPKGGGQQQPEIAVSAALGHMDVWSVLENSMQQLLDGPANKWTGEGWGGQFYERTYKTWYALLNCGLRIPAAAGTSYGRLSRLGFNRVYAKVDGPLTNASWAAALKRGDGFVTNGPLLWLRAGRDGGPCDRLPGDGLALDRPGKVNVVIELISRHPVRLVEVLSNDGILARRDVVEASMGLTLQVVLDVEEPGWLAARCFGEHEPRYPHMAARNQFAHTNPIFLTVAGKRPFSPAAAAGFIREIDALIDFAPNLPTEEMRRRALAEYRKARAVFAREPN